MKSKRVLSALFALLLLVSVAGCEERPPTVVPVVRPESWGGHHEDYAHASGDEGVLALAVRKDSPAALSSADGDYEPLQVSSGRLNVTSFLLDAMLEGGLTELVGINEEVNTSDYGGSVTVTLAAGYSGEILNFAFYATEDDAGAIQDSAGVLYILDADPAVAAGDTAMTAAEWVTVLGKVEVEAADWDVDANGGCAYIYSPPVPFHALSSLYFVWFHTDGTDLNDAAGDDEQLEFNFWYRRDS